MSACRLHCRAAQILIYHLNLVPAHLAQTILHRVLLFLALQIVAYLVSRRLAIIPISELPPLY